MFLLLFIATAASSLASHYRGASASYTINSTGGVTLQCFSVWRSDAVGVAAFQLRTGSGGTGTLLGNFATSSTINPYSTGTEYGGGGFTVVRQTFTFNLASPARPSGTYYARWESCCRVAGINNAPESTWAIELKIIYTAGQASSGPTMIPATIDIIGRGFDYNQNLNSTDPDGTPVAYQFVTGSTSPNFGPNSNIPGISLSSIGTVSISAGNTASLALGRWVYKVVVADGSGATAVRDVLVVVQAPLGNLPPVLGSIGSKTVPVNTPLSFAVSGTDPNAGQTLTVRAQRIPTGASFPQVSGVNSVSSMFNWTPSPGQEGTYLVNFEVFDNATTILIDNELVQMTVTGANNPPVLNPIGNRNVPNGGTFNFTISGSDPDAGQAVSFEAFNLPAGATFDPLTRTFTWTPAAAQYDSTFTGITFRIRDNGTPNLVDDETLSITVGAGNQAPVIAQVSAQTITAGQTLQFSVTATDGNSGQTILLTPGSGGLPPGATFPTVSGPSSSPVSSIFNWTPTVAQVGNQTVRFRAEDNGSPILNSELVVSIQVTPANLPPTGLTLLPSAVPENEPIGTIVGLLSAADPDAGDTHTYTLVSGPGDDDNVAFAIVGDEIRIAAVFDFETQDTYTIRVRTTDTGGLFYETELTILIEDVNEPPVAVSNSYNLGEDMILSPASAANGVLANDGDVDGNPLMALLVSGPSHGSLTLNPDGRFTYTPVANFNGPDTFTYKASDGMAESAVATVTINVIPVNDSPVAVNNSYNLGEDMILSPAAVANGVLGNDSDVDGNPLTALLVSGPSHGSLTLNPDGRFTYAPVANFNGPDTFTYKASDGMAESGVATVTINVIPANDTPVNITFSSASVGENLPVGTVVGTISVSDPDLGDSHTFVQVPHTPSQPLNAPNTYFLLDGNLVRTAQMFDYEAASSRPIRIRATDAGGLYVEVTFSIAILNVNEAPVADAQSVTTDEDTPVAITLTGGDVENDPLTFAVVNGPAHGSLSGTAPNVTYTPALNYHGPDSFTFKVNDGALDSDEATVSITVNPVNDAPVAALVIPDQAGEYGNPFSFTFAAGMFTDVDAGQTLSYTASALPLGITFDGSTRTFAGTPALPGTLTVVVTVTDNGAPSLSANASFKITIAPRPIEVTASEGQSKVYGTTDPAAFSYSITSGSLAFSDSLSGALTRVAGENVGPYAILQGTLTAGGNYTLTYVGADFMITPAALTVTANNRSKTYGQTVAFTGAEFTTSSLANGDTVTSVTLASAGAAASMGVGNYDIVASAAVGTGLGNYTISYVKGTLTVDAAVATVAANAKTKTYGDANPALDAVVTGQVPGGDMINYMLTSAAMQFSGVGSYPITVTLGANPNYSVTSSDSSLAVNPAVASIAANAKSKTYGDANPTLDAVVTGQVAGGDPINYTLATTALQFSGVGGYTITVTLGSNPNYTVTPTDSTLTVNAALATVVANAKSKGYGEANPPLDAVVTGQVVGGDPINYTLATTALQFSGVAGYPISVTLGANPNYTVNSSGSSLTVNQAIASVAANAKSKSYGEANPPLDALVTGQVVGGDPINYTLTTTATPLSNVGNHPITVTLGANPNYTVTPTAGTLTVNAAGLVVKADDQSRAFGEPNPTFTGTVDGLKNADQFAVSFTCSATEASLTGTYPIVPSITDQGGRLANYSVSLVNGTLTVTPAALEVTIHNPASGFLQTINNPILFTGSFTLTGNPGAYAAHWIVSSATVQETAVAATISGTAASTVIQFPTPGVYLVKLVVEDAAGTVREADLVENDLPAYVVIYDPDGGFVTGGGWINSPAGAFHPDLEEFAGVTGKATFGFVAKYQKGANVPTGNTEFQFKAGNLNFKSTAYQWLVVAGAKAQYKGVGMINGQGEFGFMLTAIDGSLLGNGRPDRFRMKIWAADASVMIYDNQSGAGDNSELTDGTIIGGGNIVIHKTK